MRRLHALLLASWVFLAPIARAADAQYVTDIPAYSILVRTPLTIIYLRTEADSV